MCRALGYMLSHRPHSDLARGIIIPVVQMRKPEMLRNIPRVTQLAIKCSGLKLSLLSTTYTHLKLTLSSRPLRQLSVKILTWQLPVCSKNLHSFVCPPSVKIVIIVLSSSENLVLGEHL